MKLLDLVDHKIEAIRQVGIRAIEDAKLDGVPAYYADPSLGPGLVREMPDGTRERLERQDGELVVVATYRARDARQS